MRWTGLGTWAGLENGLVYEVDVLGQRLVGTLTSLYKWAALGS